MYLSIYIYLYVYLSIYLSKCTVILKIFHYYISKLSNKRSCLQNKVIKFTITIFFTQNTTPVLSKVITNGSNSHDKL